MNTLVIWGRRITCPGESVMQCSCVLSLSSSLQHQSSNDSHAMKTATEVSARGPPKIERCLEPKIRVHSIEEKQAMACQLA